MEKSTLPKHQIFLFDNVLSDMKCDILTKLINILKCDKRTYDNGRNVIAEETFLDRIKNEKFRTMLSKDLDTVMHQIAHNIYLTCPNISLDAHSGLQLRKITGKTRLHPDLILDFKAIRSMSIIIALNDDYEGGELCFPEQNFKVKLKKGQAIAFPPYWTHPHHTTELLNNTVRYTINTWFLQ